MYTLSPPPDIAAMMMMRFPDCRCERLLYARHLSNDGERRQILKQCSRIVLHIDLEIGLALFYDVDGGDIPFVAGDDASQLV